MIKNQAIRILITGPESTGKSVICKLLSQHFKGAIVEEYARDYIAGLNRPYLEEDLLHIAQKQMHLEDEIKKAPLVFFDTDMTVIHIWSEEKFRHTHDWILQEMHQRTYDLYLLMDVDIPWQEDEQRENPLDRDRLLKLYQKSFEERNISYHLISGQTNTRLKNAIKIVEDFLNGIR
ncbi:MAG: ATPase [Bacteroidetes bacterium 4572_77]|nr:MAG: ATPase [Bacteroidetes bacterium 4572_77]